VFICVCTCTSLFSSVQCGTSTDKFESWIQTLCDSSSDWIQRSNCSCWDMHNVSPPLSHYGLSTYQSLHLTLPLAINSMYLWVSDNLIQDNYIQDKYLQSTAICCGSKETYTSEHFDLTADDFSFILGKSNSRKILSI